jgi:hypothetical protein
LATALAIGLSGCSLIEASQPEPLEGAAACAIGHHWKLDLKDLSTQVLDDLQKREIKATSVDGTGSQTLTWGTDYSVLIDTDYTLTATAVPSADKTYVVTQTHKGSASGKAYINSDVAIPRNWNQDGFAVRTAATLNGSRTSHLPFLIAQTDFDDVYGVEITCNGNVLTTHARQSAITKTWSKAD